MVLLDALHSIRTLISTATNETPHERFFAFQRRSSTGNSLPAWLSNPGKVLHKRHVRQSKYEPLVEEVDLIEANPNYAYIRYADGRESTVSLRDLAPRGSDNVDRVEPVLPSYNEEPFMSTDNHATGEVLGDVLGDVTVDMGLSDIAEVPTPELRRSERIRRPVERLDL